MQFPQTGHSQYNSNDRQKQAEDADVDAKRARQSVQQGALPRHIVEEENHGCDGNLDQRQEGQILGIIKGVGEKSRTRSEERRVGEVTGVQTCALPICCQDILSRKKIMDAMAIWTNARKGRSLGL